ncbi:hypothetical protein GCM10009646_34950 [Streptomyces aureus]
MRPCGPCPERLRQRSGARYHRPTLLGPCDRLELDHGPAEVGLSGAGSGASEFEPNMLRFFEGRLGLEIPRPSSTIKIGLPT